MILHRLYRKFSAATANSLVLMYHRIGEEAWDPDGVFVSPAVFEQQLQLLTRYFRVQPLDLLINSWNRGKMIKNSVALTFDDGYLDNFSVALPLLQRYGVPATFFLTNPDPPFWWDELRRRLSSLEEKEQLCVLADRWGMEWEPGISAAQIRTKLYHAMAAHLKTSSPGAIPDVLNMIGGVGSSASLTSLVRDEELARLTATSGMDIGAHTVTHPFLPGLSPERVREELARNKRFLEEKTNRPITLLAYPYGGYDATTIQEAKAAGFKGACTTRHYSFRYAPSSFEIGRYKMSNEAEPHFLLSLAREKT